MTCVELHIGVRPAMKLGSLSKVASVPHTYSGTRRILTSKKRSTIFSWDCFGKNLLLTVVFLRCSWMSMVVTFSRALKFNFSVMRRQTLKVRQKRFLIKVPFCVFLAPRISTDCAHTEGAREEKLAILWDMQREIYTKVPFKSSFFSSLGRQPNSLFSLL